MSKEFLVLETQLPIHSVSQIIQKLKDSFSTLFPMLSIQGELTALKRHTSGHRYFVLREGNVMIDALCWRHRAFPDDHDLEGAKVVCTGQLVVYPERSKYVFNVHQLVRQGQGDYLKALALLKEKLRGEGLFDRKKRLPAFPRHIGLITSATGAVIQDMRTSFTQGFPCQLSLYNTLMQGKNALASLAQAWTFFQSMTPAPDLLILARGGGSMEDLAIFNDEGLVRLLAQGTIPFISAIGHETDTTLVDCIADSRASTPTAAAQKAVPRLSAVQMDLNARLKNIHNLLKIKVSTKETSLMKLSQGLERSYKKLNQGKMRVDHGFQTVQTRLTHQLQRVAHRLAESSTVLPRLTHLSSYAQKLYQAWSKIPLGLAQTLQHKQQSFAHLCQTLEHLSIDQTLRRGFILPLEKDGKRLLTMAQAQASGQFVVRFWDGDLEVRVLKK